MSGRTKRSSPAGGPGPDRVALAVADRLGPEVGLGHAEPLLDVPEVAETNTKISKLARPRIEPLRNFDLRFPHAGSWRANRLIVTRCGDDESLEKVYDYGE